MKTFITNKLLPILDIFLSPIVYVSGLLLKKIRHKGIHRMPSCKKMLLHAGVFPVQDHYYEPQFNFSDSNKSLSTARNLAGINWNVSEQLKFIESFLFAEELINIPLERQNDFDFYMNNDNFSSGDAEYLYQIIRSIKPKRIFEVGSGFSTLIAVKATQKNQEENDNYKCKHICIEPYEMPWLEKLSVSVIRQKVEDIDISFFAELESGDILFIDSSHVIRPYGDVLYEFLTLLPSLRKGVIVHIHDIFSPHNYPCQWIENEIRFYNEQYLLEAFLTNNNQWDIIGGLNYLHHNHYTRLKNIAPFLTPDREPGSFYIRKIG